MKDKQSHKPINIKNLASDIRAEVDRMILSVEYTYREIAEYISENIKITVTPMEVCRYARDLCNKQEELLYGKKTKPQALKN